MVKRHLLSKALEVTQNAANQNGLRQFVIAMALACTLRSQCRPKSLFEIHITPVKTSPMCVGQNLSDQLMIPVLSRDRNSKRNHTHKKLKPGHHVGSNMLVIKTSNHPNTCWLFHILIVNDALSSNQIRLDQLPTTRGRHWKLKLTR